MLLTVLLPLENRYNPAAQGSHVAIAPTRISGVAETILGEALLGDWVWSVEYRESDGGVSAGVSRTSSESLEPGTR